MNNLNGLVDNETNVFDLLPSTKDSSENIDELNLHPGNFESKFLNEETEDGNIIYSDVAQIPLFNNRKEINDILDPKQIQTLMRQ